jgi:hypothetical protein
MQHHLAPTRLLDWTASPYVAAFFACEGETTDGVIWMVDYGGIQDRTHDRLRLLQKAPAMLEGGLTHISRADVESYAPCLYFVRCDVLSPRAHLQQSWFSCPALASVDHDWAIEELLRTQQEAQESDRRGWWTRKLIIPRNVKPKLLRSLWQMNVTGESLFPGLDGLGKTIAVLPQLLRPDGDLIFHWEKGLLSRQRGNRGASQRAAVQKRKTQQVRPKTRTGTKQHRDQLRRTRQGT